MNGPTLFRAWAPGYLWAIGFDCLTVLVLESFYHTLKCDTRRKTRGRLLFPVKQKDSVEGLALLVTGRVPQEPELLDLWKAAWDHLIWKAVIPKVKAIEGELNRNPLGLSLGRSQTPHYNPCEGSLVLRRPCYCAWLLCIQQ